MIIFLNLCVNFWEVCTTEMELIATRLIVVDHVIPANNMEGVVMGVSVQKRLNQTVQENGLVDLVV